jgi:hypothetical protein
VPETVAPGYYSSYEDVTILETITFQANITLPQGTSENVEIYVDAPYTPGILAILNGTVYFMGSTLSSTTLNQNSAASLVDTNGDGIKDRAVFNFSTILNVPDNVEYGVNDTIILEVVAIVADSSSNYQGENLTTVLQYYNQNGYYNKTIGVDLVEPFLQSTLVVSSPTADAGDILNYTLNITHTAASHSVALFLNVAKELNSNLQLVPGSLTTTLGNSSEANNGIAVTLERFDIGDQLIIQYPSRISR